MSKQSSKLIELRFPVGGLNRAAGFDQQPPYTTPHCQNVRPYDMVHLAGVKTHGFRQRGGSRPGLVKTELTRIETGPIQMLTQAWVLSSAGAKDSILLASAAGTLYQNASGTMAEVTGGPHFNSTTRYLEGTQVATKFYVADYRSENLTGVDGTIASTNRLSATSIADWTALSISTTDDVVFISGSVDSEANIFPISSVTSGYIVFDGTMTNQSGGVTWQVGRIPKVFDPANPTAALTGLMGTLPITPSFYNTGRVSSANGIVSLLAAGGGTWDGLNAYATDAGNMTLTLPNASGIGTTSYRVMNNSVATPGPGSATSGLTLLDTSTAADCTNVTYELSWSSDYYGIPPLNCPHCCTYRGRLVLAGDGWYMSRVLNPNDWDYGYSPSDPSRAMAGTSTTTGGVPEPITALIPHSDQYLIFGCERSLWLLTGDPAYGGSITALSREVGVLGPRAWCSLPDGSTVILSRNGLYHIGAGGTSRPQALSSEALPWEFRDIDWTAYAVSVCWESWSFGIHISWTPNAGNAVGNTHYFFDWTTKSFWPVVFAANVQPTAMTQYAADASSGSRLMIGSYDGYLREYLVPNPSGTNMSGDWATWVQGTGVDANGGTLTPATSPQWPVGCMVGQKFLITVTDGEQVEYTCFSNTATSAVMTTAGDATSYASWKLSGTDDGTSIVSQICYGPFRLGGPGYYGEITQIAGDLSAKGGKYYYDSEGVVWGIFEGETAEKAVYNAVVSYNTGASAATWHGDWVAGETHREFPHAVGVAFVIMVSGSAGWAIEGIRIEAKQGGPIR
jgi:hypothetical protein